MAYYIKKQPKVEAIQLCKTNKQEAREFLSQNSLLPVFGRKRVGDTYVQYEKGIYIPYPAGGLVPASFGDYILKNENGSFKVYKPKDFEKEYQLVQ